MKLKATIGAILMAGGLLVSGAASAVLIPTPANLNAWNALLPPSFNDVAPGDNDTTWSLLGFSCAGTGCGTDFGLTGLSLTENLFNGIITYVFSFNFNSLSGGQLGPNAVANVDYQILIFAPNESWLDFSLDSTCAPGASGCIVDKVVNGVVLTSIDGNPVGPAGLSGILLTVHETFVVGTSGVLNNATDTYRLTTNAVPEPLSLALLGIGLAALGFTRRKA